MAKDLKADILARLDFRALYARELGDLKNGRADQALALCPFHEDTRASLSLNVKTGLWHCFGCGAGGDVFAFMQKRYDSDFRGALNILAREVGVEIKGNGGRGGKPREPQPRIVETYDYLDQEGNLRFQVCRTDPKGFFQRRPDGSGGWVNNVKGLPLVPYRLPELLKADKVFITEGEKDADAVSLPGPYGFLQPHGRRQVAVSL